eukprot:comp21218_c0_seq1/m.28857 comp21218_c0_seq1/g.28857  ORF comp21218_c0_seq1/g.28857 comp21218_c0_seq1/m.28857 type:complete len:120 (-) comp21218_c0_seq1:377-736(-)
MASSRYRYGQPGPAYGGANPDPYAQERQQRSHEQDNDSLILDLHNKVGMLKNLSHGIGDEVRAQNRFLDDMHDDFDKSNNLLTSSMRRLKTLAAKGGGNFCYLSLFCIFVFFVTYWLIR